MAPFGLTLLFILTVYSTPGLLVPALDAIGPAQVVGGAALALLFVERMLSRSGLDMIWPESYFMLAFLWIAGLSCFDAAWMKWSVQASIDLLKYAALFILLTNTIDRLGRLKLAMWAMVIGGLVPALGTIKNYVTGNIHEGERVHWVGIFANSNDLAYSLIILIPLAAALMVTSDRPAVKTVLIGCIGLFLAASFVTFSRGGMLGLLAVLGLLGLRQDSKAFRLLIVFLVIASLAAVSMFWTRDQGFTDLTSDATVNERIVTIQTGMEMFFDRPLLGVGIGGSVAAFPDYVEANLGFEKALIIHNTFVQALAEVGLLGTIALVLLVGAGLLRAYRLSKQAMAAGETDLGRLLTGLELAMWGYLVCGLSGGYVMSWFPYMLIALIAASTKCEEAKRIEQG